MNSLVNVMIFRILQMGMIVLFGATGLSLNLGFLKLSILCHHLSILYLRFLKRVVLGEIR